MQQPKSFWLSFGAVSVRIINSTPTTLPPAALHNHQQALTEGRISGGHTFSGENFLRGKFRHTSNFGAVPSDMCNLCCFWYSGWLLNMGLGKGLRARGEGFRGWFACICLTGSPLAGGPREICHQLPPAAKAKEQEIPQIVLKIFMGKIFASK